MVIKMKKNVLKILSSIAFIMAIILAIAFIIIIVLGYQSYKELITNPLIDILPYSYAIKDLAIKLLLPAFLLAVTGFIIKRIGR